MAVKHDGREMEGANGPALRPGRITDHGHRHPCLYRGRILPIASLIFKYPGGVGAKPHASGRAGAVVRGDGGMSPGPSCGDGQAASKGFSGSRIEGPSSLMR